MIHTYCARAETLSVVGSQVLQKHPELGALKVVFLPQVSPKRFSFDENIAYQTQLLFKLCLYRWDS